MNLKIIELCASLCFSLSVTKALESGAKHPDRSTFLSEQSCNQVLMLSLATSTPARTLQIGETVQQLSIVGGAKHSLDLPRGGCVARAGRSLVKTDDDSHRLLAG
mmetsp:Transcript_30807/g.43128  ORF Transcript_30807/g.43128 Transcript_30807/m.43128 type:complete len:105 (+) Transcript_30807:107-421(+)